MGVGYTSEYVCQNWLKVRLRSERFIAYKLHFNRKKRNACFIITTKSQWHMIDKHLFLICMSVGHRGQLCPIRVPIWGSRVDKGGSFLRDGRSTRQQSAPCIRISVFRLWFCSNAAWLQVATYSHLRKRDYSARNCIPYERSLTNLHLWKDGKCFKIAGLHTWNNRRAKQDWV